MLKEEIKKDIVVIGGGLAGICAAISAARNGKKVALIQNRSVLGGNSSSEIRVWVSSATKHGVNRYARETGIMGELFVENQYRNRDGNPYIWDALLLEKVMKEANIELFLDTDINDIVCDENNYIRSVSGWMQGSERLIKFVGTFFIDCTGDGIIGYLAGAEYLLGREGKDRFDESLAPDVADKELMGSTLLFYTKEEKKPVNFIAPAFSKDISKTEILKNRIIRSGDKGANYWWIEWGGEKDIVTDNAEIRSELLSIIFGIWDYIKNSGKFDADYLTLEWVGTIPGKREYRRLIGDYILTQQDIENQTDFKDKIGFGGWSMDLHPSKGIYNKNGGAHHAVADGIYHIPYRMLYSKNILNLFMAGRDVSASHVAFGGVRIMGTCALMGEAVGTAATIAIEKNCSPRGIYEEYLEELLQTLLKNDASIIGEKNKDTNDLMQEAVVSTSSFLNEINTYTNEFQKYPLENDIAFSFPVNPQVSEISLYLASNDETELVVELWDTGKGQNYIPNKKIMEEKISIHHGSTQWIDLSLKWFPNVPQNAFLIVKQNPKISLYLSEGKHPGILSYENKPIEEMNHPDLHVFTRDSPVLHWTTQGIHNENFIFRIKDETRAFYPNNILNGYVRPYFGPNIWASRFKGKSEWIQLDFNKNQKIGQIRITFDDDVNEDLINLHHHYTESPVMPELVKDFKILILSDGIWKEATAIFDNRKRHIIINFDKPIQTEAIKLELLNTNGSSYISVYEIRAYEGE